ncbi:tyrosine-type recombinase/integrase [Actinokineospora enzanensis]|uniref:tyrosine-type recombinase/integrase n=1 Tax=Actinokineospora enzanensis TaxID=155975 RepID=UPI0012EB3CCF|nr:integrase [Actinokineospora enzanensis]
MQWSVSRQRFKKPFKTEALADSFRSTLVSTSRKGEAFDLKSGLPLTLLRKETKHISWFQHACNLVDAKWDESSPGQRRTVADTLVPITLALTVPRKDRPSDEVLRKAMRRAFSPNRRDTGHPPDIADALIWLVANTRPVSDLEEPSVLREVLTKIERKMDGHRAAPNTIRLRRVTLGVALDYACVEEKILTTNPLKNGAVKKRKQAVRQVDRRSVINAVQFRTILAEVRKIGRTGRKLVAFFAVMFFAGLRPEEVTALRRADLVLPPRVWDEDAQKWRVTETGDINVAVATPEVGGAWTDSGRPNEERGLKHRAEDEFRRAPMAPELALILYEHVDEFGILLDGLLFVAERGGRIGSSTYCRVWSQAREVAFTPEVAASALAKRPYDLRHACVSFWLILGVEAARVAAWAGHSLAVLMRVYAAYIDAGEGRARQLIASM